MDNDEQQALDDIAKYGCHILHVLEDQENPGFSYSIGVEQTTGCPDLIVYGMKAEICQWVINEYYRRVKGGDVFVPKQRYWGFIDGFEVEFIEVNKHHYREHFGWGFWYNKGGDFRMLQLVYPSTLGVWPWDSSAPDEFTWFQPLLDR